MMSCVRPAWFSGSACDKINLSPRWQKEDHMLTHQELRELSQVSGIRSTEAIVGDWLAVALLLALTMHWLWLWPLAFLLMGRQQLALAILMHDGAHRRLYRSGGTNDRVGQLVIAAPLFFSMDSYKKLHLKHHLNPLVPDDPDLSLIGGYPISRRSFYRKLARDFLGISYFKFIRYFIYLNSASGPGKRRESDAPAPAGKGAPSRPGGPAASPLSRGWIIGSIALAQFLIFSALWLSGHPWLYLTLWVLPLMTVLQVLLRIRGIAEHAGYAPGPDQRLNARTVVNPAQTFFFAPHGVHYHIEHHVYPSVPYHRLARVHRLMRERGSIPETNLYSGYGRILAELVR